MFSLPVCTPTTDGRLALVPSAKEQPALVFKRLSAVPKLAGVTPASRLEVRPAPEMVSSGIREIDALTGGLPRGCLSEICGPASSGRTSILLAALAAATHRKEVCALVDVTDAFDPMSATAAGVDFERLLWIRCGNQEKQDQRERSENFVARALRVTDLLLQSGGFGLLAIDLGDVPLQAARRIPLTSWFRFQRAVEHTATVLFVITQAPLAQSCASLVLQLRVSEKLSALSRQLSEKLLPAHTQLLDGIGIEGELLRSRIERKPAGSVTTAFTTKAIRAG